MYLFNQLFLIVEHRQKKHEFLDSHLKTIMQESWSYIKDSADFINKIG